MAHWLFHTVTQLSSRNSSSSLLLPVIFDTVLEVWGRGVHSCHPLSAILGNWGARWPPARAWAEDTMLTKSTHSLGLWILNTESRTKPSSRMKLSHLSSGKLTSLSVNSALGSLEPPHFLLLVSLFLLPFLLFSNYPILCTFIYFLIYF